MKPRDESTSFPMESLDEERNLLMESSIPEDIKSIMLLVLDGKKQAVQFLCEVPLPDLTACGLYMDSEEFTVDPVPQSVKSKIQELGIALPAEEPAKNYLYFVSRDPEIPGILKKAFKEKNWDLIKKINQAGVTRTESMN